jgi:hypothetical protein
MNDTGLQSRVEGALSGAAIMPSLAAVLIALDKPEWQDEHMIIRRAYAHRSLSQ